MRTYSVSIQAHTCAPQAHTCAMYVRAYTAHSHFLADSPTDRSEKYVSVPENKALLYFPVQGFWLC